MCSSDLERGLECLLLAGHDIEDRVFEDHRTILARGRRCRLRGWGEPVDHAGDERDQPGDLADSLGMS